MKTLVQNTNTNGQNKNDQNTKHYTIDMIRDEARQLVEKGAVSRHQPIYILCQYIPAREWVCVECELEQCDYLLRDQIGDLIASETWESD